MKLLLTSGGITNPSIERALVDLLGKPIAESSALCVATAIYAGDETAIKVVNTEIDVVSEGHWKLFSPD